MKKKICIKCSKEYEEFTFHNFNLDLCPTCCEIKDLIERDEFVDNVTHKITCPLCKKTYGLEIVDEKCKTKDCPVHFFWGDLDSCAFAMWVKK